MPGSSPGVTAKCAAPKPSRLIHRHTREFDHLAPFLGLVSDELAEFAGRHRLRNSADVAKPRDHLGIFQGLADCLVENVDDFRRRSLWRGDAVESDRFQSWKRLGS